MLTIFSMADARYFPVTLHARGDIQGSLGDPKPDTPSSEEPSLMRTQNKTLMRPKLKAALLYLFGHLEAALNKTSDILSPYKVIWGTY